MNYIFKKLLVVIVSTILTASFASCSEKKYNIYILKNDFTEVEINEEDYEIIIHKLCVDVEYIGEKPNCNYILKKNYKLPIKQKKVKKNGYIEYFANDIKKGKGIKIFLMLKTTDYIFADMELDLHDKNIKISYYPQVMELKKIKGTK